MAMIFWKFFALKYLVVGSDGIPLHELDKDSKDRSRNGQEIPMEENGTVSIDIHEYVKGEWDISLKVLVLMMVLVLMVLVLMVLVLMDLVLMVLVLMVLVLMVLVLTVLVLMLVVPMVRFQVVLKLHLAVNSYIDLLENNSG